MWYVVVNSSNHLFMLCISCVPPSPFCLLGGALSNFCGHLSYDTLLESSGLWNRRLAVHVLHSCYMVLWAEGTPFELRSVQDYFFTIFCSVCAARLLYATIDSGDPVRDLIRIQGSQWKESTAWSQSQLIFQYFSVKIDFTKENSLYFITLLFTEKILE